MFWRYGSIIIRKKTNYKQHNINESPEPVKRIWRFFLENFYWKLNLFEIETILKLLNNKKRSLNNMAVS